MLPASDLTEIIANLSAANLQPNTAAQILAAILAPLLRNSGPRPARPTSDPMSGCSTLNALVPLVSHPIPGFQGGTKMLKIAANLSLAVALISATPAQSASYHKVPYRFHAHWCKVKEGPDRLFYQRCREGDKLAQETSQTLRIDANTAVINKKGEIYSCWLREPVRDKARKQARKTARTRATSNPPEPRQRAARFLREQLGRCPKQVTDVEAAASKAHVDSTALEQARADLGVVVSRGNAGGVQAVQWSLPG